MDNTKHGMHLNLKMKQEPGGFKILVHFFL